MCESACGGRKGISKYSQWLTPQPEQSHSIAPTNCFEHHKVRFSLTASQKNRNNHCVSWWCFVWKIAETSHNSGTYTLYHMRLSYWHSWPARLNGWAISMYVSPSPFQSEILDNIKNKQPRWEQLRNIQCMMCGYSTRVNICFWVTYGWCLRSLLQHLREGKYGGKPAGNPRIAPQLLLGQSPISRVKDGI